MVARFSDEPSGYPLELRRDPAVREKARRRMALIQAARAMPARPIDPTLPGAKGPWTSGRDR
jgi:hypothetical protein